MFKFIDFLALLRVKQWYKNILIFIPLVFSFNLFDINLFLLTSLGFLSLCFVSSSYYIINDLVDIKKDKHHPEKKNRPLASGKISKPKALITSAILFVTSLILASLLSIYFLYSVVILFILSQLYTLYLRNFIFLDIIFISLNFVIRAVSGIFIVKTVISYWVILLTFFISVFLVSGKRELETKIKGIKHYRSSYSEKDADTLSSLSSISVSVMLVFFSLYSILQDKGKLLVSLPISLYILISYIHCKEICPEKIRNPEKFIFDKKIIFAILLWIILIVGLLYY